MLGDNNHMEHRTYRDNTNTQTEINHNIATSNIINHQHH